MAQTKEGARKAAAKRAGVSVERYAQLVSAGMRWCSGHKDWHSINEFGRDAARSDGMAAHCFRVRKERFYTHEPIPAHLRKRMGPKRHASRDNDKIQARHHVNLSVRTGKLAHPKDLPCMDCGHRGAGRRHEYDHFMGYSAVYHMAIQCVCSKCHHVREKIRNGS